MEHILSGLNAEQKKAVETVTGPVLIVAGAGAGKTKTLTTRIAYIIGGGYADPENILAITFTNKAAKEMKERVYSLLEKINIQTYTRPLVVTFHSLCVRILREQYEHTNRGKNFSIFDTDDSLSLIKEAIRESGLDPKTYEPKRFSSIISRYKNKGIDSFEFGQYIETSFDELVKDVWSRYEKKLINEKAYDFDDLLLVTTKLLRTNTTIRTYYQEKFSYIHIDEYQDTNGVQYELVKLLLNPQKNNICAVGDTDQNIYSWRGAQIKNMIAFEKDFPNSQTIFLEENYRSTDVILQAANAVIEKNTVRIPKNLYTKTYSKELITVAEVYSERDEAEYVIDTITETWDSGVVLSDIAILYRANFQSRVFEEACIARGIPYIMTGTKFYERREIKDTISYIRAAQNRDSLTDIKRTINTPTRGIGKTTLLKVLENKIDTLPLKAHVNVMSYFSILDSIKKTLEEKKPSEIIRHTITVSGLYASFDPKTEDGATRRENLEELVTLAKNYDEKENGIENFLEDVLLQSDQDTLDNQKESRDSIKLMTIHAAKGLEFKIVYIVGLEHGLFPHERSEKLAKEDSEEERRLFYVALTRAKEKIYLTYATTRTIFGMRGVQTPSEFLFDIPIELIEQAKPKKRSGETIIYIE